jgi:ABC-2 type transport system permease protein
MIYTIFKKEIAQYLSKPTGYIALAVFFVALWLFCWVFPSTSFLQYGFAEMGSFFEIAPYILLFLIPALTMRLFSEEFKTGTYELLITKPISIFNIIWGKYFSVWVLVLIALLFTSCYFISLYSIANPVGNIDFSGITGSYLGLWLLAGVFCAIGVFSSSITDNQIIAFIISLVACFVLYDGLNSLAQVESFSGNISYFLQNISLYTHFESMGRGVIDSRDLIYFLSIIIFFIFLTKINLQFRKNRK